MNEITVETATHANQYGWSDVTPFEILEKRTARKIIVREMDAVLDPNFKADVSVGGFVGHVNNNHEQSYVYHSNINNSEIAVRLDKKGIWKDKYGRKYNLNTTPRKFYDYNF
jgi:hypothetical protein